jgi:hypothetical protein
VTTSVAWRIATGGQLVPRTLISEIRAMHMTDGLGAPASQCLDREKTPPPNTQDEESVRGTGSAGTRRWPDPGSTQAAEQHSSSTMGLLKRQSPRDVQGFVHVPRSRGPRL